MATKQAAQSHASHAIIPCCVFTGIAGAVVITRCIARFGYKGRGGADDALIVCSSAFSVTLTILVWLQAQHGLGRHFNTLAPGEYMEMLKPLWVSIWIYNLSLTCTKISIILQYLRFFVGSTIRRASWTMLGIIVVYGTWTLLASIFTCLPVAYFWDKTIQGGHCLNLRGYWFSNAALNIVTDIMICVMPLPVLHSLLLPRRQKNGLILVFCLGGCVCILSILRLHSLYIVSSSTDMTWDNPGAAAWSSAEVNIGIICACLPSLRPLLTSIYPCAMRSSGDNHDENNAVRSPPLRDSYVRHADERDGWADESGAGRAVMLVAQSEDVNANGGGGGRQSFWLQELEKGKIRWHGREVV